MKIQDIVFIQGHEAKKYLDTIENQGVEHCVKELSEFDLDNSGDIYEGDTTTVLVRSIIGREPSWEAHGEYIIHWSNRFQCIGLLKII